MSEPTIQSSPPLPTVPDIELSREIGRGGMGSVYLGRQTYLDRTVAVKFMHGSPNDAAARLFTERFRREAKILASLAHPNICACHQAGTLPDGTCYLVMEFIDGPNLRQWLEETGALPEPVAIEVTRQLAHALGFAKARGIIHRDVKPENVLLQKLNPAPPEGSFPFRAKLVDLGLARPIATEEATRLTAAGAILGTPSTMAPEQINDPDSVDWRADIYALGCILFHMATGRRAFPQNKFTDILLLKAQGQVPDPRDAKADISEPLRDLIMRLMQADREKRPQKYEEIVAACDGLLGVPTPRQSFDALPPMGASRDGISLQTPTTLRGSAMQPAKKPVPVVVFIGLGVVLLAASIPFYASISGRKRQEAPSGTALQPTPVAPQAAPAPAAAPAPVAVQQWGPEQIPFTRDNPWSNWLPPTSPEGEWGAVYDLETVPPLMAGATDSRAFPIPPGPVRVTGVLSFIAEAGVAIVLADGRWVGLRLQYTGGERALVTPVRYDGALKSGVAEVRLGASGPVPATVDDFEEVPHARVPFVLLMDGTGLRFEAGGTEIAFDAAKLGAPVSPAMVSGIGLFAHNGTHDRTMIPELRFQRPAP